MSKPLAAGQYLNVWEPVSEANLGFYSLNDANKRIAYVWKQPSKTNNNLSKLLWYNRNTGGSFNSNNCASSIWTCTSDGQLVTRISSEIFLANNVAKILDYSSSPIVLTPDNWYAVVIRNSDAAPASNWLGPASNTGGDWQADTAFMMYSQDGSNWNIRNELPPIAMLYADGKTYLAYGYGDSNNSTDSTYGLLYNSGSRYSIAGIRHIPATRRIVYKISANIVGYYASLSLVPNLCAQIYRGDELIAESANTYQHYLVSGVAQMANFEFPNGVLIEPTSDYTYAISVRGTVLGNAANYLKIGCGIYTWPFCPFQGFENTMIEGVHGVYSTAIGMPIWNVWQYQPWMRVYYTPGALRGEM